MFSSSLKREVGVGEESVQKRVERGRIRRVQGGRETDWPQLLGEVGGKADLGKRLV